ncbi:MAG: MarR family transcriptional regulator [Prolixibacteraceae bacterium]|nr:MarR family transcriptional regulator [Prolixibacteraceae bacterium]
MKKEFIRKIRAVLRRFDRELFFQNTSSCCNGVSMAQCHALLEIENKENITVTELSENLMLNKSTISRTVDGLVNVGLIDREIPKENRRITTLNLSENGQKVCEDIHWNNDQFITQTLSVLGDTEKEQFLLLLDKVTMKMLALRNDFDKNKNCC